MEGNDKLRKVFRDIDKQKEQIRTISNPFEQLMQSYEQSLATFDYKPYNPNEGLEELARQQLDVLNEIKQDTSLISSVILLIQKDVAGSSRHLELIKESLEIATSTTKEEAESKFDKLVTKINTTVEGVQNIQTLVNWAKTIYILYTSSN